MPTAVPVRDSSIAPLARVLRRGFDDEPAQRWLFPARIVRAVASEFWFRGMLHAAERAGEVWKLADAPTVAVWFDSEKSLPKKTLADVAFAAIVGLSRRTWRAKAALDRELMQRRPKERHWYLAAVATDAAMRSRGLGRAVLQPVIAECDRRGIPCYLETSAPRSLGFYASLGFSITDSFSVLGGPTVWCMRRDSVPSTTQ